jgi:ABC-type enterochelin transport system permease subunit
MSIDKIVWAVSLLAAVIFAFVTGMEFAGLILVVLGLASGFFVKGDHRKALILAAVFLGMGGAGALETIPAVGGYLTAILTNYGAVLGAASVMVILMATIERLVPGMATAAAE